MNYNELGLNKTNETIEMGWKDKKINILKCLPIQDKYDIVMITLQKSAEDGIYNPIKLDMYFHLNLIYMYTDIVFSSEDMEDETKIYDEIKSSGFLAEFLTHVNKNEYIEMQEDIDTIADLKMHYATTAASVLRNLIDDLPANAEAAQSIVDNFDPAKYKAVVDFAKAANGGRSL